MLLVSTANATMLIPVFVLVVAFMIPPFQPVIQNLEVLANLFFFNALAWAWVGRLSNQSL
mgnify:CR=1 FL=1|jgi:hypothetical protein